MYADTYSDSMNEAITETQRRRAIQEEYNKVHGITPKTIIKDIKEVVTNEVTGKKPKLSKKERVLQIEQIEKEMREAAAAMDFERAMELRDIYFELKGI